MTFIFRNRTIFWDIPKWNRRQTKWTEGVLFSFLWTWNLEFILIDVLETLTVKLLMIIGFDFTYWLFKDSFAFYVVIVHLLGKNFASVQLLSHVSPIGSVGDVTINGIRVKLIMSYGLGALQHNMTLTNTLAI